MNDNSNASRRVYTRTELRLLRLLDAWDDGNGVIFEDAPAGRTRHPQSGDRFNNSTFRPLNREGLIDVGNGFTDPIRITEAGRHVINGTAS